VHGLTQNAILKTLRMQFEICKVIFDINADNVNEKLCLFDEINNKLYDNG